ncbi:hypothetical protein BJ912DRAFT_1061423 [Pholiota molesta]|nr:hypothetical protein BJ912DRAFT_1061423 [Pholiota molesta]
MEKMQRTMAAWCEKMKDREAALRLESQNLDGERRRSEVAAETVLPPSELPPARVAAMTSPSPVSVAQPIPTQPQTRSLSTLSSNASTATRDSIDIHLSDPPPISSTSTSTLYSAVDDPGATSTITSTKTGNPTISVHDENGAEGPLVRIHATGSARVRLLELVKTLVSGENVEKQKEVLSKDAIVQCVAEDAVAEEGGETGLETVAMDVDVFGSRPNLDPRRKIDDTSAIVLQDTAICGSGSTPTHPT